MKSIKAKISISILAVTTLVIGCVWIFQVVFLQQIYTTQKRNEIHNDVTNIMTIVSDPDKLPQNDLKKICAEKNYSLEFFFPDYGTSVLFEPVGSMNILRDAPVQQKDILIKLMSMDPGAILQSEQYTSQGNEYTLVAVYNNNENGSYVLMLAAELAPVREAVTAIRTQLIYLSIILFAISVILSIVLSNSLTKPILKLSEAAKQVSTGDLSVQVQIHSKDEIGVLAQNFNQMVQDIERSNKLQKELVANVSHDFRTPLTMIKGYAETIKDLTGDNKQKREQQLDVIIAESNRLNLLANDILDLSKLQAGRQQMQPVAFDLGIKLRDILKRYDLLATNEQFNFSLEAPEHVVVYADEIKLEQVIFNIINNATNHTGEDKKVMIRAIEKEKTVRVEIEDTGPGISKEDLPLIWERYYKPYKKKDRKGMGTGLGLSIVKAILEAHHFTYGVDSEPGQGSVFWFEVVKATPEQKTDSPEIIIS